MPDAPSVQFIRDRSGTAAIAVLRAVVARSHGVAPNAIRLDVVPFDAADLAYGGRQGTLAIEYGGAVLELRGCIIDKTSFVLNPRNQITTLILLDKRWKWQYGYCRGHLNRSNFGGKLIAPDREEAIRRREWSASRTLRQLAERLLRDMDEVSPDDPEEQVAALPEGPGPEVQWEFDNPAVELDQLCTQFGCRVIMDWSNDVKLWRLGQSIADTEQKKEWDSPQERAAERRAQRLARLYGSRDNPPLPDVMPVISYSESVDNTERPDEIRIVTAPTMFQWDFELEAVGLDTDGSIKLLKDLSYAPNANRTDGGFGGPDGIWGPATGISNLADLSEEQRKLATASVFKWYRIKTPFRFPSQFEDEDGNVTWYDIENIKEITPIYNSMAATTVEDGFITTRPAVIYGKFSLGGDNNVDQIVPLPLSQKGKNGPIAKTEKMIVNVGNYIDTRKGIVKFTNSAGIAALDNSNNWEPATLRLRAAFNWRFYTGDWWRQWYSRSLPEPHLDTEPLIVRRPDITAVREAVFGKNFDDVQIDTNDPEIEKLVEAHFDVLQDAFFGSRPTRVEYAGFYPQIELDGVIRQISFSIDVTDRSAPIRTLVDFDQDAAGYGQESMLLLRQSQTVRKLRDKVTVASERIWARRLAREQQDP
jgi:hypothetical protein